MDREGIPDEVKRFILVSIQSIPYLEAILLLRRESRHAWDSKQVARRLYMSEKAASELLLALHAAEVVVATEQQAPSFRYHPGSDQLRQMIDRLAEAYSNHLVAVTNLIHSKSDRKAQHLADAFRW
jgi:Mn-dependent DtxR family transcriptional regulator